MWLEAPPCVLMKECISPRQAKCCPGESSGELNGYGRGSGSGQLGLGGRCSLCSGPWLRYPERAWGKVLTLSSAGAGWWIWSIGSVMSGDGADSIDAFSALNYGKTGDDWNGLDFSRQVPKQLKGVYRRLRDRDGLESWLLCMTLVSFQRLCSRIKYIYQIQTELIENGLWSILLAEKRAQKGPIHTYPLPSKPVILNLIIRIL